MCAIPGKKYGISTFRFTDSFERYVNPVGVILNVLVKEMHTLLIIVKKINIEFVE